MANIWMRSFLKENIDFFRFFVFKRYLYHLVLWIIKFIYSYIISVRAALQSPVGIGSRHLEQRNFLSGKIEKISHQKG